MRAEDEQEPSGLTVGSCVRIADERVVIWGQRLHEHSGVVRQIALYRDTPYLVAFPTLTTGRLIVTPWADWYAAAELLVLSAAEPDAGESE